MFLIRKTGHRLILDALKSAGSDFQKITKQTSDPAALAAEMERHEHFAQDLLKRVEAGEMNEKYSQTPSALERLFKQVTHAALLAASLRLFVAYEQARTSIYGDGQ